VAVRAAESKKAADIRVLDLTGVTSFADFFVISTGANQKQVQAITDEVILRLKREADEAPLHVEGYDLAEWVLADYGDLLVHIFSPRAREYYGLERLWRSAKPVEIPGEPPGGGARGPGAGG
jgi:ribosome-associated protein